MLFRSRRAGQHVRERQAGTDGVHHAHGAAPPGRSDEVGQVVAAGQAVVKLARTDALEVAFAVPEARAQAVRSLKVAEVSLWADGSRRYPAALRELSAVADPLTRTYAARVSILQPDEHVLLGMTANVTFPGETGGVGASGTASRIQVPLTAIFQQEGKPALWVVAPDQTIALRPVKVASYGEVTAVLESGVTVGERIVVAGVHKLTAGETVEAVISVPATIVTKENVDQYYKADAVF